MFFKFFKRKKKKATIPPPPLTGTMAPRDPVPNASTTPGPAVPPVPPHSTTIPFMPAGYPVDPEHMGVSKNTDKHPDPTPKHFVRVDPYTKPPIHEEDFDPVSPEIPWQETGVMVCCTPEETTVEDEE